MRSKKRIVLFLSQMATTAKLYSIVSKEIDTKCTSPSIPLLQALAGNETNDSFLVSLVGYTLS